MNKRKSFNTISETKSNTVHLKYTPVFPATKPRSEPARLRLPDFSGLAFPDFV